MGRRRLKPIKNNMPNTDAEDYHFPKQMHPCKAKPNEWMAMMELKGFKVR
jgi:hypothetical protein